MEITVGQKIHGFTAERVRCLADIKGTLAELRHDKTGAQLCWFNNGDQNKLFSVAFKTLPEDSTGVFHILEHSVLNGSERYPVKEPFVELLKGSMNTFLNAMTAPDFTIYPVSSRNTQDFLNLTDVYLDAVFAPAILTDPNIFRQEGWHTELAEIGGEPVFKGVVFNEMKGAMSSVDEQVSAGITETLYPDVCYGFNSGGDPEHIPDLTYERFVATYRRFYHPSNTRFWLDGDLPIEETLARIDGYLSRFERSDAVREIGVQQPVPAQTVTRMYEIGADEETAEKTQVVLAKLAGTWQDMEQVIGAGVLADALTGSNDAPLKRAVLEKGLGQDVSMSMSDSMAQNHFCLWIHNTEAEKAVEIRRVVRETAETLVKNGIDRRDLEASLNRTAFRLKEPNEPQGLYRAFFAAQSWLYGGDPAMYLQPDGAIASLRARLDSGWYEELLHSLLLDETGLIELDLIPSKTLGEERRAKEAARLRAEHDARTAEEKQALADMNSALIAWQQKPDDPADLARLPALSLSEVSPEPQRIPTEVIPQDGVTVLFHEAACPGIAHLNLYFSLADRSLDELRELALLADLLGELPTKRHSVSELQREVKTYTGALDFGLDAHGTPEEPAVCRPVLACTCSVLTENLPKAYELIREILTETDFSQTDRIREIVLQADEGARQSVVGDGTRYAAGRANAHYSAAAAVREVFSGIESVRWVHETAQDFGGRIGKAVREMERLASETVCRARLTMSVTAAEPQDLAPFLAMLPAGTPVPDKSAYALDLPEKEGIRIPAQICYTANVIDLAGTGAVYDASSRVLSNILTYGFLWNAVRVQGGAYGVSGMITRGGIGASSFRDPSAKKTLAAYRGMGDFVRAFCAGGEATDKYIIAAIAQGEPLITPAQQGRIADARFFSGLTWEKQLAERRRMLDTKPADLLAWAEPLDALGQKGAVCVIGAPDVLDACADEGLVLSDL